LGLSFTGATECASWEACVEALRQLKDRIAERRRANIVSGDVVFLANVRFDVVVAAVSAVLPGYFRFATSAPRGASPCR